MKLVCSPSITDSSFQKTGFLAANAPDVALKCKPLILFQKEGLQMISKHKRQIDYPTTSEDLDGVLSREFDNILVSKF